MIRNQDLPDQFGVVDQENKPRLDGHRNQISIRGGFLHELDRLPDIAE